MFVVNKSIEMEKNIIFHIRKPEQMATMQVVNKTCLNIPWSLFKYSMVFIYSLTSIYFIYWNDQ